MRNRRAVIKSPKRRGPKIDGFADTHNNKRDSSPVTCFYFDNCHDRAVACKEGKAMCRKHLDRAQGVEFPLRVPMPYEVGKIDQSLEMAGAFPRI